MNPIFKNVLALLAGAVIGGIVNMGIITISPSLVPLPAGIDPTDPESYVAGAHLLTTKHYLMPFLAHALGTLVGAFVAAKFSDHAKMTWAYIIGIFFLIGGITASLMIPAPTWFKALDLLVAYLPMAWIGGKLGIGKKA